MMPAEQTGYTILAYVLERLGTTPILLFAAIMQLAPWVVTAWIVWRLPKLVNKINVTQEARMQTVFERQDARHAEVVRMYEDNVQLVKDGHVIANNYHKSTEDLQGLILLTGQTMQKLVDTGEKNTQIMIDLIRGNNFCPLVRQAVKPIIEEGS